jgi:hypothetical protein
MKFRNMLGGAYLNVWEAFAAEAGGTLVNPGIGKSPRIEIPHARGPIRIEGHVVMIMTGKVLIPVISTRLSALLPATHEQRFSVSRANFATAVADWFGALDIQVDDPEFDAAFVLKGETPDLVRAIFADADLRARFLRDFEGQLHRHDDATFFGDPTPDIDPFELSVPGYVDSIERLRALFTLFVATLDRLPA